MFNQPHVATLKRDTVDAFGSITGTQVEDFNCLVELDTKYGMKKGQAAIIGIGVIFTTSCLRFKEGDTLVVDEVEYIITKLASCCDGDGVFHHWELIYG